MLAFLSGLFVFGLILVCGLLILIVLVQKGRGGGLAGAFGGSGGSGSAFGAKTGDVFTWITVGLASVFFLVSVIANYAMEPTGPAPRPAIGSGATPVDVTPVEPAAPADAPAPAATPAEGAGDESSEASPDEGGGDASDAASSEPEEATGTTEEPDGP